MQIKELKKCPFCGRNATIVMNPGSNWDGKQGSSITVGALHGLWYVGCSNSWFEGIDDLPDCQIKPNGGWWANLDDGIEAWNNRNE